MLRAPWRDDLYSIWLFPGTCQIRLHCVLFCALWACHMKPLICKTAKYMDQYWLNKKPSNSRSGSVMSLASSSLKLGILGNIWRRRCIFGLRTFIISSLSLWIGSILKGWDSQTWSVAHIIAKWVKRGKLNTVRVVRPVANGLRGSSKTHLATPNWLSKENNSIQNRSNLPCKHFLKAQVFFSCPVWGDCKQSQLLFARLGNSQMLSWGCYWNCCDTFWFWRFRNKSLSRRPSL